MSDWEKQLACAARCAVCGAGLQQKDPRILSVITHEVICMDCKGDEEQRPDYADRAKAMISDCLNASGRPYGSPEGYCFHHFCRFTCR